MTRRLQSGSVTARWSNRTHGGSGRGEQGRTGAMEGANQRPRLETRACVVPQTWPEPGLAERGPRQGPRSARNAHLVVTGDCGRG